jgi:hypothetical protein
MTKLIEIAGNVVAVLGLVVCVVAGISRLGQSWYVAGFETMVLFNVGIGLMVAGCLAKLQVLGSK